MRPRAPSGLSDAEWRSSTVSVYAAAANLREYAQDSGVLIPADNAEAERLLVRAELDVDLIAGPWPILSTGRKFDPPTLPVTAREALRRGTCAQAVFRIAKGEDELIGTVDDIACFGSLTLRPGVIVPRIGPRVLEELAGHGLLIRSGTVPPEVDGAAA